MQVDDRLCETDVQVLREMNGEDTGMPGGAAMLSCASYLKKLGYAQGFYEISDKGRDYLAALDQKAE